MHCRGTALGGWRARPAVLLLLAGWMGAAAATPGRSPGEALQRAYEDAELQRSLPPAAFTSSDVDATAERSPLKRLLLWIGRGGFAAAALRLLAEGIAVVVVLLGGVWLLRRIREPSDVEERGAETTRAGLLDAMPLLEAEALAQAARFREAIHVLLLRTFEMLARRSGSRLVPGMTGREVLVRLALPDAARPALADLVDAVEATAFAGQSASLDDYQKCAARFSVLQRVLGEARA
jgi:hypothetical protein